MTKINYQKDRIANKLNKYERIKFLKKNKIKNYHYANLHYQTSRVDATRNHTAPSVFVNVDFVNVTLYLFCGTL